MEADRENKLDGEIINVVREEREWKKMSYWPKEFVRRDPYEDSDDDEEEEGRDNPNRRVGEMPPSDDDDEEE